MIYRTYGRFGYRISQLGFGAMRLPRTADGEFDMDGSIEVLRTGLDMGINYFDSAYGYGGEGRSEKAVGRALAGRRKDVFISTKIPVHSRNVDLGRWRQHMEEQLDRLGTDYIDFWHFHDLAPGDFEQKVMPKGGLMDVVQKAKDEGLVRHICVSSHQPPAMTRTYLDTGCFDGVTLQYNILNRANEETIDYAHAKGMGVIVMGPVGGGRLAQPSKRLAEMKPEGVGSMPELALRFVLSNPHVTCAMSGMNTLAMVDQNVAAATQDAPLSDADRARIAQMADELKRLADLYCTGCGYCLPCPNDVAIPRNFELMNYLRVYGFDALARDGYARLGTRDAENPSPFQQKNLRASECVDCGECADKCPQKIDIPAQLSEVADTLG